MKLKAFLLITTGAITLSASILDSPAQAASLTYDFAVNVSSGTLAGNQYNGFFSFDNSVLTGKGSERIAPADGLKVSFNFLGNNYTESDDAGSPDYPIVDFLDGKLQGLSFAVLDNKIANPVNFFSIGNTTPGSDGGGNYFVYGNSSDPGNPLGDGVVNYTPVPTPALLPGLLGMGAAALRKKRKESAEQVAEVIEV